MIRLTFSIDDIELTPEQAAAKSEGALDSEQVYYQYICSTASGHDPDEAPDDKVRDSHAALHGTVWRLDDPLAPVPPLGTNCRCGMRYCGKPESVAADVLGATAPSEPTNAPDAFGEWLDDHQPKWEAYAKAAENVKPADRLGSIYMALKDAGATGDLREKARMIARAGGL